MIVEKLQSPTVRNNALAGRLCTTTANQWRKGLKKNLVHNRKFDIDFLWLRCQFPESELVVYSGLQGSHGQMKKGAFGRKKMFFNVFGINTNHEQRANV